MNTRPHQILYELSLRYAPPKINLRDAEILDSYGSTNWAKLKVNHKDPDDVTRKELKYYPNVYPFMNFEDLLFYFYPIAREFEKRQNMDCYYSFLFSLSKRWVTEKRSVTDEDILAIKDGIQWMWDVSGNDHHAFGENLLMLIDVSPDDR